MIALIFDNIFHRSMQEGMYFSSKMLHSRKGKYRNKRMTNRYSQQVGFKKQQPNLLFIDQSGVYNI